MPTSYSSRYVCDKLTPAIRPGDAVTIEIKLPANSSFAKGTVLGEITANLGTFNTYASGNTDGTQNPKGVLESDCQTDANGNITFSSTAGQVTGDHGQTYPVAQLYVAGWFRTEDLVGLDANAATKLGSLKRGSVTTGLLHII